ncbi:MAG: sugar phosphate nucleotidyltransferase [Candidatus Cyclobacteriaceae bacterium M3_2C_046]
MNIIVPMAGIGKRMRPHTLTVPKPLIPIAGKPIVQRLVEDIARVCNQKIDQVGFVIGEFGAEVEKRLLEIAHSIGAEGKIFYQDEALGTAHAVFCAHPIMEGNTIVAFADTLFRADFQLDFNQEGIIWVQEVEDPSAFGVVKKDQNNFITDFVEKPSQPVSNLAIIGIYYFKQGEILKEEIKKIIDQDLKDSGEYQLTRVLRNMTERGVKFVPGKVDEWLDCGNKNATVNTNKRYLEYLKEKKLVSDSVKLENAVIIPPCYIGEQVELHNTIIGPYVSIGKNSVVKDSRITNSIIQENTLIRNIVLQNSMLGNFVTFEGKVSDLSIGDYSIVVQ